MFSATRMLLFSPFFFFFSLPFGASKGKLSSAIMIAKMATPLQIVIVTSSDRIDPHCNAMLLDNVTGLCCSSGRDPPSIQTFFNFKSAQSLCLLRHCCSSTSWTMKKIQLQPFQRRPVPVASFDLDFQMRIQGQLMLFELPQFYLLNHKEDHMMLTTFAFSKQTVSRLHSTS